MIDKEVEIKKSIPAREISLLSSITETQTTSEVGTTVLHKKGKQALVGS